MIVLKVILFTLFITGSHCRHPDKVYCVNERCDEPISKAKTLLSYTSGDPDLISYRSNSEAIVYMKSAGTNPELWYVKINGKAGFANFKFLRENKLIEKNPLIVVPYEPKAQENIQPDRVKQAHEVVEGTTIYTTEAAVNNAQQETITEPPTTTSNEEHTPSLIGAKEILNENSPNNVPNISSQTNNEVNENQLAENQNSEPTPADKLLASDGTIKMLKETNPVETDLNVGMPDIESSTQTIPNSAEEVLITDDATPKEPASEEQLKLEVPNKISSESSAQSLLSSISGTLNNKDLLDVPDNKVFNSLTESEQTDSIEQNISSANSNVENVPLTQETTTEPNVINGDISSSSEAVTNQIQEENNPLESKNSETEAVSSENIVQTDENTASQVETLVDQKETILPGITPFITEETTTVPPVEIPTTMETIPTVPPTLETTTPSSLDTIPVFPPVLETIPPLSPLENVPSTLPESNPIPNLPHEVPAIIESQFLSTTETPKTLPDLTDTIPVTTETIPPIYSQVPQSITEEGLFFDTFTTPTPDNNLENADNVQSTTESLEENTGPPSSEQLEDMPSTTETPAEDMQGFISNMFSTVADIWPSTTETAPSIYNAEEYPSYESEKIDKTEEVNTGFSFMKHILSSYYSVMGTGEEAKALFDSVAETCYSGDYCDGTSNDSRNRLLTFLLTTASSVLLFTLGYYYIDNRRQDGRLIGQINSLQRDLLFTSKECEILKEELTSTKNKLAGIEDSSFGMDDMVQSLKEEINELKATNERLRNSLDDNEKLLRVSENTAGELQNTLGEVENTLSELLAERANSEEQIVELNGKIQAFEEELISVSRDRDNFQLKYVSAESALEEFKKLKKQFEDVNQQLTEAKNTIELQKYEIDALKDAIRELKSGTPSNVDVTSLIDHTEIKAKLSKAIQEKKVLETKYEAERKEKARLSDELQTTQETLHTTSQNASEALTRLDVLGKYFQEREGELMKELTAKESLWLSKQGESASTVEKIELLQQEVQRYKEKCDALTLELAEQESSRRTALSNVEARAHAAWLEARAAKRDTDAARDEAAALRRKLASLTTMASADGAVSPHHKVASPLENVENPVIPPPLPPMFLPPPLLPPLPRPPPLGRLPSPHPPRYGRYSPESRYSPDSRYSPETVRYSPDSRYSPRSRRSPYSPRSRRRSRSRERYEETRVTRSRNGPADTETEYNSDSPTREPRRRGRYSRHSGPSSGSGCSSESDK